MLKRTLRFGEGIKGMKAAGVQIALLAHGVDRRDARLAQERLGGFRLAVDEFGAELDRDVEARHAARPAAAADALARFEHYDRASAARKFRRGGEACRAGADDDNVYWTFTPVFATTSRQRPISFLICSWNCPALPPAGATPSVCSWSAVSLMWRVLFTSVLIRSTTAGGRPFGPVSPCRTGTS